MALVNEIPENTGEAVGGGETLCPIGTPALIRVINQKAMFCECTPVELGHICAHAFQFAGGTYCRKLWKSRLW
jgi:hypothetical protein